MIRLNNPKETNVCLNNYLDYGYNYKKYNFRLIMDCLTRLLPWNKLYYHGLNERGLLLK